jgi:hypothetical protein
MMADGIMMADSVNASGARTSTTYTSAAAWGSNLIEPSSMKMNEEQVLLQGEAAMPSSVNRLSSSSPLYPRK